MEECRIDVEVVRRNSNCTSEDVKLVSKVRDSSNYFQVLGLPWPGWSSTKKIKNAYTNLSKKLDPHKNKAPGAEEALKKVNDAFNCLSHRPSRFLHAFIADWDSNGDSSHLTGVLFILGAIIVILPFFCISPDPTTTPYEIKVSGDYKLPMTTKEYGIVFYVTSQDEFEEKYPSRTVARVFIEHKILTDYRRLLQTYCSHELDWYSKRPDFPTPICDNLGTIFIG
uniref:uncharacterized protein LOC122601822 n=1 Tax=Erigeron canadensis TaxID=72917 RepID=UPI001CB90E41|nr:uncharacterized protein LOC122601822 [Erigeron canadensis]